MFNHKKRRLINIFRYFEWTFTPQTRKLQGRDLHTTRFRLSPTFYFSTSDFFFWIFVGVSFGGHFDQNWEVFHPPSRAPLLRQKNMEIWGRSLGSVLAKNHPNRSYPRPLLAASCIAEGTSQGGSGGWGAGAPPPGNAMPGKESLIVNR